MLNGTDYFPFGSEMRSSRLANYRFGFNGKELDKSQEFGILNAYDYGFRIYNPGIGRFLSVDPLMPKYPSWTPYAFAMNRPIDGIDLDGLEWANSTDVEGYNRQSKENIFSRIFNKQLGTSNTVAGVDNNAYVWLGKDLFKNNSGKYSTNPNLVNRGNNWQKVSFDAKGLYTQDILQLLGSESSSLVLSANEHGVVELPVTSTTGDNSGDGTFSMGGKVMYGVFNRNDANNAEIGDQYGTPRGIAKMFNAIVDYTSQYPGDIVSIGEMRSRTNGQTYKNNIGGLHHADPDAFDVRLLGVGGSYKGLVTDSAFDVLRTQNFINALSRQGFPRILIGESVAPLLVAPNGFKIKPDSPVHNNHMHVDFTNY